MSLWWRDNAENRYPPVILAFVPDRQSNRTLIDADGSGTQEGAHGLEPRLALS
jgi:hypothetical protein